MQSPPETELRLSLIKQQSDTKIFRDITESPSMDINANQNTVKEFDLSK